MRILFCNIAWMKYYKGVWDGDIPHNGGGYVKRTQMAGEEYNFLPVLNEADGREFCYGSVETKHTRADRSNELHIEKLEGCEAMEKAESVDEVLVIFCARPERGREKNYTRVVGWYQHATVYREYQLETLLFDADEEEIGYNIFADKKDVVLLPEGIRSRRTQWFVPRANEQGYGFGQANVWFPVNLPPAGKAYVDSLVKRIMAYTGDNWIDRVD